MIDGEGIFFIPAITGFVLAFPIPMFARRFGKFLPADAGTALVRCFHILRIAAPDDKIRRARRRKLWGKLLLACLFFGLAGMIAPFALLMSGYSISLYVMLWLCGLLACIDERMRLLPDVLTVPLLITGFYFSCHSLMTIRPFESAGGAMFGFVLPTAAAALTTPFRPRAMGGGDFKMLAGLGAWLGVLGLAYAILASVFCFGAIAVCRRDREGPYGLSLVVGTLIVLILQKIPQAEFLFVII